MGKAYDVKNEIKTILDTLVSTDLGQVIISDFRKDFWEQDIAKYPAAIISTPGISASEVKTNAQNLRTYEFEIVVIMKGENITHIYDVENLMDKIADAFDNNPTLNGVACGAIEPTTTPIQAVSYQDKTFVMFSIIIRAKVMIELTF